MNKEVNPLVLAYIGDSIYEVYIRNFLIEKNIAKVKRLQQESIKYVSAKEQAKFLKQLINNQFFKEEELKIAFRARNHNMTHKPKNTDIITYKHATALEAVIGYLYLQNNYARIEEIMNRIVGK